MKVADYETRMRLLEDAATLAHRNHTRAHCECGRWTVQDSFTGMWHCPDMCGGLLTRDQVAHLVFRDLLAGEGFDD